LVLAVALFSIYIVNVARRWRGAFHRENIIAQTLKVSALTIGFSASPFTFPKKATKETSTRNL
jgi:hypothetical protein